MKQTKDFVVACLICLALFALLGIMAKAFYSAIVFGWSLF